MGDGAKNAVKAVTAVLAAASLAAAFIADHEGWINTGYKDPIGIVTRCAGHVQGAVLGQVYSDDECAVDLANDVVGKGLAIAPCIKVPISVETRAAFISFAFNVGAPAFCRSTLVRKLNAGDAKGACAELSRWVNAGGRPLPGLVKRRADERALCEKGLTA
jgi:lysozyme